MCPIGQRPFELVRACLLLLVVDDRMQADIHFEKQSAESSKAWAARHRIVTRGTCLALLPPFPNLTDVQSLQLEAFAVTFGELGTIDV